MENPKVFRICDDTKYKGTRILNLTRKPSKTNKSGVKGVCFEKAVNKYVAYIGIQGRTIKLGRFNSFEDAVAARKAAEEKYWEPIIQEYEKATANIAKTPTLRQQNRELYWAWTAMKQRCNNPNAQAYHNYGGRGITYCEEWNEFDPFCYWALENGYKKGLQLDRIDNDGNYEPGNCRWTTRTINTQNRRATHWLTVNGEKKCVSEWARVTNVNKITIQNWCRVHGDAYAESRIADVLENGYIEKDYSYSHRKAVRHLESGQVFPSVRQAAKACGVSPCRLSVIINKHIESKYGTFEFVE